MDTGILVLVTIVFSLAMLAPVVLWFRSIRATTDAFDSAMGSLGLTRKKTEAASNQALYEGFVHGVRMVVSKVGSDQMRLFAALRHPLDFELRLRPTRHAAKMQDRGLDRDCFDEGVSVDSDFDRALTQLLDDVELRQAVAQFLGYRDVIGQVTRSGIEALTFNHDHRHALDVIERMLAVEERLSSHGEDPDGVPASF